MMRFWQWPGLFFTLVLMWKAVLVFTTVQPIPANDSFFYDGPVVNYIRNGNYTNPSLQLAFPISSGKVFSAYPPLYQGVLFSWMKVVGTSARSAILFHVLLFSVYAFLLYRILKRLKTPVWAMHIAGAFLFAITFHDRPDSLAHVLGLGGLLSCIKDANGPPGVERGSVGSYWIASVLVILCLATSIQIGAAYSFFVFGCILTFSGCSSRAWMSVIVGIVVPATLVLLVKLCMPLWWDGFVEHARQTPSFTGFRIPEVSDLLKVIKAVPGILLVGFLVLLWAARGRRHDLFISCLRFSKQAEPGTVLLIWVLAAAGIIVCASLTFLTSNTVAIASYLQPLLAGIGVAVLVPASIRLWAGVVMTSAILLASTRAVGMSTWGVVASRDVSYQQAIELTRDTLKQASDGDIVVLSAPYLYETISFKNLRMIHSDWLGPARVQMVDVPGYEDISKVKPTLLILTQFDFYRRYGTILGSLESRGDLEIRVRNTAGIGVPDSSPALQRVIQHISWAPVIVKLRWR